MGYDDAGICSLVFETNGVPSVLNQEEYCQNPIKWKSKWKYAWQKNTNLERCLHTERNSVPTTTGWKQSQ